MINEQDGNPPGRSGVGDFLRMVQEPADRPEYLYHRRAVGNGSGLLQPDALRGAGLIWINPLPHKM